MALGYGRRGVEAFYEDHLLGQVGFQTIETDAHGRIKKVIDKNQAVVGEDLHMYLDAELQVQHTTLWRFSRCGGRDRAGNRRDPGDGEQAGL